MLVRPFFPFLFFPSVLRKYHTINHVLYQRSSHHTIPYHTIPHHKKSKIQKVQNVEERLRDGTTAWWDKTRPRASKQTTPKRIVRGLTSLGLWKDCVVLVRLEFWGVLAWGIEGLGFVGFGVWGLVGVYYGSGRWWFGGLVGGCLLGLELDLEVHLGAWLGWTCTWTGARATWWELVGRKEWSIILLGSVVGREVCWGVG